MQKTKFRQNLDRFRTPQITDGGGKTQSVHHDVLSRAPRTHEGVVTAQTQIQIIDQRH